MVWLPTRCLRAISRIDKPARESRRIAAYSSTFDSRGIHTTPHNGRPAAPPPMHGSRSTPKATPTPRQRSRVNHPATRSIVNESIEHPTKSSNEQPTTPAIRSKSINRSAYRRPCSTAETHCTDLPTCSARPACVIPAARRRTAILPPITRNRPKPTSRVTNPNHTRPAATHVAAGHDLLPRFTDRKPRKLAQTLPKFTNKRCQNSPAEPGDCSTPVQQCGNFAGHETSCNDVGSSRLGSYANGDRLCHDH
jgi:hypothetical protein